MATASSYKWTRCLSASNNASHKRIGQLVSVWLHVMLVSAACVCHSCFLHHATAADAVYANAPSDKHLKEWLVLGPIPAQEDGATPDLANARKTGFEQDLLDEAGGETKVDPEADEAVAVRGGEQKWRVHESSTDEIDLIKALGKHEFAVGYAAATIESSDEQSR